MNARGESFRKELPSRRSFETEPKPLKVFALKCSFVVLELKFLDGREARKCTWLDLPDAFSGEIKVIRKGRCVQASNQFQRLGALEDVAAHQQPLLRALTWSARRNHGAT